jgi:hypothetical protein
MNQNNKKNHVTLKSAKQHHCIIICNAIERGRILFYAFSLVIHFFLFVLYCYIDIYSVVLLDFCSHFLSSFSIATCFTPSIILFSSFI